MVGLVAVQAFSLVVASGDRSLVVVHRLLAVVGPLVAEHRLWAHKLQQCSTWAQQLQIQGSRAQAHELQCMDLVTLGHMGSSQIRD